MANILIIGAGHAGVEAAFVLAKAGHRVTLRSNEPHLPYFRPRLIAVAFGQAAPEAIRIKPAEAYAAAGITLVHAPVTELDPLTKTVEGVTYDGILLTQGARPFVPAFAGAGVSRVKTLWSLDEAVALREICTPGRKLVLIGGGVLGLEAALRARMAGCDVAVIEVAPCLLNGTLGPDGEAALCAALAEKNISLHRGHAVADISETAVTLTDGTVIPAEVVLCSAGARPNISLAQHLNLPVACGVKTQTTLALAPGLYAAGDTAQPCERRPTCSVRRAAAMGALAARNLMAELAGEAPAPWQEPDLPLFMKVEDVEFHLLLPESCDGLTSQRVDDGSDPKVAKTVLCRNGRPVGLQWIGTRAGFAEWEKKLAAV